MKGDTNFGLWTWANLCPLKHSGSITVHENVYHCQTTILNDYTVLTVINSVNTHLDHVSIDDV